MNSPLAEFPGRCSPSLAACQQSSSLSLSPPLPCHRSLAESKIQITLNSDSLSVKRLQFENLCHGLLNRQPTGLSLHTNTGSWKINFNFSTFCFNTSPSFCISPRSDIRKRDGSKKARACISRAWRDRYPCQSISPASQADGQIGAPLVQCVRAFGRINFIPSTLGWQNFMNFADNAAGGYKLAFRKCHLLTASH